MKNVKYRGKKDEFRGEIPRVNFGGKNPNSAIFRGPRKTVGPNNNPRKCDISNEILRICKKFIASSSNNIFYIQIHHFTQQTMLNQTLYYKIQYLELNTKSKGVVTTTPLVADVTINSLVT